MLLKPAGLNQRCTQPPCRYGSVVSVSLLILRLNCNIFLLGQ